MTSYEVYIEITGGGLEWLGRAEARSAKAAAAAVVEKPDDNANYCVVPTRNMTFTKPKTKPAQVSWS